MDFYGKLARRFREDARLTQEQVGEKCGVTAQAVGWWEREKNKPLPIHVRKLAELYGCSVDVISDLNPDELRPLDRDSKADRKVKPRSFPSFKGRGFYSSSRELPAEIQASDSYAEYEEVRKGNKPCPGCLVMASRIVDMASRLPDITPEDRDALRQAGILMRRGALEGPGSLHAPKLSVQEARDVREGKDDKLEDGEGNE